MDLPVFKYHSDPITTGSIEQSEVACACCSKKRGFIYVGPIYAEVEVEEYICPWCIADGSAYRKFGAEFTDAAGVGGYGEWDEVTEVVIREVAYRTPGFLGWQQERWWTHCSDAADFLGPASYEDIEGYGPELAEALRSEAGFTNDKEWLEYYQALDRENAPTAYLFRCLHCGAVGGYSDYP